MVSPAPSKPCARGSLSTHVLFQAVTHLQSLHKYPLSLFSPKTWGQTPSLFLSPSEHPQADVLTVAAFSPTLLYPLRSNHSPLPFQPAQTGSKEDKSQTHFNRSLLQSPLASTTTDPPLPALVLWEFWLCGDGTALASTMCPGCGVNTGATLCLRLAVVSVLALSHWESGHWTWDTTKG